MPFSKIISSHELTEALLAAGSRFGISSNFERVLNASKKLGRPERSFPSIHVAGTNGKGSVTIAKIAAALYLSGLKVGLYTSPHISSLSERECSLRGPRLACSVAKKRL